MEFCGGCAFRWDRARARDHSYKSARSREHARSHLDAHPPQNSNATSKFDYTTNMGSIEAALNDLKSQEHLNYATTTKKYGVDYSTLSHRHRGVTQPRGSQEDHGQLLSNQ